MSDVDLSRIWIVRHQRMTRFLRMCPRGQGSRVSAKPLSDSILSPHRRRDFPVGLRMLLPAEDLAQHDERDRWRCDEHEREYDQLSRCNLANFQTTDDKYENADC